MKKMMKTVWVLFGAALCASGAFAESEVTVTSVTAQQRYPWNGKVDITVTFTCAAEDRNGVDCFFAATNSATKAAISVAHLTRNGTDTGSGTTWTRKYIWDAVADVGMEKIDDDAFVGCESLLAVYAPARQQALVRAALTQSGLDVSKVLFYDYDAPEIRDGGQWSVSFNRGGGEGAMPVLSFAPDRVVALPKCMFEKSGKRFAGWACSNGRRYDDGMLVFNLAQPGETVTMTAIWED